MNKKTFAVTVLLILLCTSAIGSIVNAAIEVPQKIETPKDVDTTKVLNFLRDIFQIDTTKYDATLLSASTRPWNDVAYTTGQYDLAYCDYDNFVVGSCSLTVSFGFWNSDFVDCSLYPAPNDGLLHYVQKPDGDLRKTATGVLQRYQAYNKDEQINQMINLLKTADFTNGYTKTTDNLQLSVTVNDYATYLRWSNTINGASYSSLGLGFRNGELMDFSDDRAFYVLGSSVVSVSREQAIGVALEQAAGFSYRVGDEVVSGFDVVSEYIQVQSSTLPRPSESLLVRYPIWIVDLPLNQMYPGMISVIRVMLWADTGEVISVQPLGAGFPNTYLDDSAHGSSSSLQYNGLSSIANNKHLIVYLAGACIAIISSIAIAVVVFKRRNK